MSDSWIARFPDLARLEPADRSFLAQAATIVTLPAGQTVFALGSTCDNYLFVLDGTVRVHMTSETGREVVLYRVSAGDTCLLTTSALFGHDTYAAEGITETPVQAVMLPAVSFERLIQTSQVFRAFVFATMGQRLAQLMHVIHEVAFVRVDQRLAGRLLDRCDPAGRLTLTHYELAVELGSVREVVSRRLKEFERAGWVRLDRSGIRLVDRAALAALAGHAAG